MSDEPIYVIEEKSSGLLLASDPFFFHEGLGKYLHNLVEKDASTKGKWLGHKGIARAQQLLLGDGFRTLEVEVVDEG